jgi:integrase
MTPADAQAVVAAFEGHRLERLVTVILGLGPRLGEALALKWSAVDLEDRQLRIVATLQRLPDPDGSRQRVLGEPKTRQSRRALPLPDAVAAALQSERSRQRLMQLGARPGHWQESHCVSTTSTEAPWTGPGVLNTFRAQLARAGIPKMRLHDRRHGCASLLLAQGVPARVVMEVLGHSQISMTLDTYSHVTPGLLGVGADAMNASLWPG